MKHCLLFAAIAVLTSSSSIRCQQESITVSKDIELIRLVDSTYVHVSKSEMPPYGIVSSNGLLFIDNGKAFLFDTPVTNDLTRTLVRWIEDTMNVKIVGFVPNHWHADCMGGIAYLDSIGIESYANVLTVDIAKSRSLPVPEHGFKDSLSLRLGEKTIECFYPGPAHSIDNIVVWIPSGRVLFAGCMVKDANSTTLGNTIDGDVKAYAKTIEKVLSRYHDARFVVPGHGRFGGIELLRHTKKLAESN